MEIRTRVNKTYVFTFWAISTLTKINEVTKTIDMFFSSFFAANYKQK